jgi:hypothetical protein
MVYAIQLYLGFRNAARRNATASNITAKFATSTLYGEPQVDSIPHLWHATDPALAVTARFVSAPERDAVWTQLDTLLGTGINGPVTGSRGWIHDCPADIPDAGGCVIDLERTW